MNFEDINCDMEVQDFDFTEMIKFQDIIQAHFLLNEHKFGYKYYESRISGNEIEVIVFMQQDNELPCEIFNLFDFRINRFYRISTVRDKSKVSRQAYKVKVQFL